MRDLFQFLKVVVLSVFVSLLVGACTGSNSTSSMPGGGNSDPDGGTPADDLRRVDYEKGTFDCGSAERGGLSESAECPNTEDYCRCDEGLTCNTANNPARCILPVGATEPCSYDWNCVGELLCNFAYGDFPIGKCMPPAGNNELCYLDDSMCEVGLVCNGAVGEAQCMVPSGEGAACSDDLDCRREFVCNTHAIYRLPEANDHSGQCRPPGTEGHPCDYSPDDIGDCDISRFYCCDGGFPSPCAIATCVARPGEGEQCYDDEWGDSYGTKQSCLPGLVCVPPEEFADRICIPVPTAGTPCRPTSDTSHECGDLLCLPSLTGSVCSEPHAVGGLCEGQDDCQPGLICDWTVDPPVCRVP